MQGFVKGLSLSTSKGIPYVCIITDPATQGGPWQALAIRFVGGPLEGVIGIGKSEKEALENAQKEADQRFSP